MIDINVNLLETSIEQYNDMVVPKIPVFKSQNIITEVCFFNPNQGIKRQRYPKDEKIIVVLKGAGIIMIEDKQYDVSSGSTVLIEKGKWHEIINGKKGRMTIYQITKANAKTEYE